MYLRYRRMLTQQQSCHTVITSPPYGDDKNGVGYFQFSRNMLFWLGISLEEQKRKRESILGAELAHTGFTAADLKKGGKAYDQWPAIERAW